MYDESTDTYWPDPVEYDSFDFGGFNPVSDLETATPTVIGSDVYYYNADGTYTGLNTETGESFPVTAAQLASMQNPQTTGNASMGTLTGTPTKGTANTPSGLTNTINKLFGSNMTGQQLASLGLVGAGGLAGLMTNLNKPKITPVGYQGKIPELVANRTMVTAPPTLVPSPTGQFLTAYRPGQGGVNYGGDVTYTPKSAAVPAASAPAVAAAAGIHPAVEPYAQGGIAGLAHGGRYLQGSTDGMADKLPTSIDGKQAAALSHGEFVVPADVVSHLGNGNSDAGAKKLYSMMDKIRQARTGTKKQGKRINPDKKDDKHHTHTPAEKK